MAYFGSENKRTILLSKALTAFCCYARIIYPPCAALMYYLVVVSLTLMQAFVFQSCSTKAEQFNA